MKPGGGGGEGRGGRSAVNFDAHTYATGVLFKTALD